MSQQMSFGVQVNQLTDSDKKVNCPAFSEYLRINLPSDTISLCLSEGLCALLLGFIKRAVTDNNMNFEELEIQLNEEKLRDFDKWILLKEPDVVSSIRGVRYQHKDGVKKIQFASAISIPGQIVTVKYGMADITSFTFLLMLCIREFVQSLPAQQAASNVLTTYVKLLTDLKEIGELPVSGTSGFVQKVDSGDFKAKNIQLIKLTGTVGKLIQNIQLFINQHDIYQVDCELDRFADVPKPGFDFAPILTDIGWFNSIIDTQQLPLIADPNPVQPARKAKKTAEPKSKVARPEFLDDEKLSSAAKQMMTARYIRSGNGGCYHQLLIGPPSTGKSTIAKYAKDLPSSSVSFSASGDRTSVLGNFASSLENGNRVFIPVLGKMTDVWKRGMLLALRAALINRKHSIETVLSEFSALPITETLANLVKDPKSPVLLKEFESLADPTDKESWNVVNKAYFQSGAADVGATVRFNVEEIFHSAANRDIQNLLTTALDDRRELDPSAAGFDCSTLYGYNVQVVATGNPDISSPLTNAIKSRFSSLAFVGIPSREEKLRRARMAIESACRAADGEKIIQEPLSLSLEDAISNPEFVKPTPLSEKAEEAILRFVDWTEISYKDMSLPSYLDGRAINQMFLTAGAYLTWGETPRDAVGFALEPLIYSMAFIDHNGIPIQEKLETVRSKADSYFKSL